MIFAYLSLIFALFFSAKAEAQFLYRQVTNLATPVTTNARYPFMLGTTATIVTLVDENDSSKKYTRHTSNKKPLRGDGRWGDKYGTYNLAIGYTGAAVLYGIAAWETHHFDNVVLLGEALAHAGLVTWTLKNTVRERRPNGEDRKSFPSAHAAMSTAFASVVHAVHGFGWGMLAYGAATYVCFSRMNDGAHYLHDVIAGATIGMSYGWGVYLNKVGKYHKRNASNHQFQVAPSPDLEGAQLAYQYSF